jgi:hypothetical protein
LITVTELKIDNPAQRLLDILEAGKSYPKTDGCRAVWQQILLVEGMEEQHLLTRLARVMELPGRIVQVREDNFAILRGKSTYWKTRVDRAFVSQGLNSTWSSFQITSMIVHSPSLACCPICLKPGSTCGYRSRRNRCSAGTDNATA